MALCSYVDGCQCVSVDPIAFRKMRDIRFLRNFGGRLPGFRVSHSKRIAMRVAAVRNTISAHLMLTVIHQHLLNCLNQLNAQLDYSRNVKTFIKIYIKMLLRVSV